MSKGKTILAVVGMIGSGKGTCTDFLKDRDLPTIHFGNMVYEEVQRRGLDNVKDEVFVRHDMRAKEGLAVMAKHASKRADEAFEDGHEVVVFDGLYSWSEYVFLSQKYGDGVIKLIAVVTPRQTRYDRTLSRDDKHRKYDSVEQIQKRETDEVENMEKGAPIAYADYYLLNTGTINDLIENLKKVLTELYIQY